MPLLTLLTDEAVQALIDEKWLDLFAFYKIDASDAFKGGPRMAATWANMAFHLARDHVPAFSAPPRKQGKPATRKMDDVTLVYHVELLKRRDALSERKAISQIAEKQIVTGTETTLLQRYNRAKPKFIPMVKIFDNMALQLGPDVVVREMERALSDDIKDSILSSE